MSVFGTKTAVTAFGSMLRNEIEKAGMTSAEIVRQTGIYKGNFSGILNGRQSLDAKTALRIAETLPPAACRRLLVAYAREIACAPLLKYVEISEAAPIASTGPAEGRRITIGLAPSNRKSKTPPEPSKKCIPVVTIINYDDQFERIE